MAGVALLQHFVICSPNKCSHAITPPKLQCSCWDWCWNEIMKLLIEDVWMCFSNRSIIVFVFEPVVHTCHRCEGCFCRKRVLLHFRTKILFLEDHCIMKQTWKHIWFSGHLREYFVFYSTKKKFGWKLCIKSQHNIKTGRLVAENGPPYSCVDILRRFDLSLNLVYAISSISKNKG